MNNNRKGLLVGFTKWQTTVAYPMFKKFFNEYNIDLVFEILKKGSQNANTFAEKTLNEVKNAMGINYFADNNFIDEQKALLKTKNTLA